MTSFLTAAHWEKVGVRHHHGICLPLSSIVTTNSCGIGEYLDLIPLIKWLSTTGFDTIQLLPLFDTGDDPSPYMGISSTALHPIYLSLKSLPNISLLTEAIPFFNSLVALNTTDRVHYKEVLEKKLHILNLYLDRFLPEIQEQREYLSFVEENKTWLDTYAIFKTLKNLNNQKPWWKWNFFDYDVKAVAREKAIQFLCFQQCRYVKTVANESHILLKGDIPILLNKDSADVWENPEYFLLDMDVGTPPDMYNTSGQHWGFPLFNWKNKEKELLTWWTERLKMQEQLFHLYRLDHIVGFFRLWAIPSKKRADQGSFIPETEAEWLCLGTRLLTHIISSSPLLPIGEDLGSIPDLVRTTMHSLGIPGVKVLRWERNWNTDESFIAPSSFSPESLTTLSTHDSSLMKEWWKKEPQNSQQMAYDYTLNWSPTLTTKTYLDLFSIAHSSESLFHINLFNEYLSLFPELSWKSTQKERINIPGTRSKNNWAYRCKKPLEEIFSHTEIASLFKNLSQSSYSIVE